MKGQLSIVVISSIIPPEAGAWDGPPPVLELPPYVSMIFGLPTSSDYSCLGTISRQRIGTIRRKILIDRSAPKPFLLIRQNVFCINARNVHGICGSNIMEDRVFVHRDLTVYVHLWATAYVWWTDAVSGAGFGHQFNVSSHHIVV